ncbi:MAG: magnesium transporter [Candidatus Nezhaarchaeota archaeon]|nr:magnesium transporter [Candidatus Nezhaarchaeota archaeon]MCX8141507.1 magnesium transporter [Candidatus Nezhaarchaeota archaeon]MDW8049774.1 magnesium transporter [Nitrososphaerota archaeon]
MGPSSDSMKAIDAIVEKIRSEEVSEAIKIFESLDPPKAMDVILRLNEEDRLKIFTVSSLENLVEVLARLPDDIVYELASVKGIDDMVEMLVRLPVDEVADVLCKLPPKIRTEILKVLPHELSTEVAKVMKFPPESVGGIMTTQVPIFEEHLTVEEAIDAYIQKTKLGLYDKHNYVYVVNGDKRLVGYIDVKTLLTKPRTAKLKDCVERVGMYIDPFRDREEAAKMAMAYDLMEVPVVDLNGRFLGVVSLDDLLDVVVSEHTEDLLKYGGILKVIRGSYIVTNPLKLAVRRAPMLIYLYLVNIITGGIVATFEGVIQSVAILAAFMPMLADNSGNIGSQATALILRGLVTGEVKLSRSDAVRVTLKEFLATTFMLLLLAPLAFSIGFIIPFVSLRDVSYAIEIAVVVSVALTMSCYVADITGALLPMLLAKLKVDPAVASAPVVTSLGDIVTVLTYFMIAKTMLIT